MDVSDLDSECDSVASSTMGGVGSAPSRMDELLADFPTPTGSSWDPEPLTLSFLRRYRYASGVYVMRHHRAYQQSVADVFKVGRCDNLSRRYQDYRGAMTIVAFLPTVFPRTVERLALGFLRRFVVHGQETVCLPLPVVLEVCREAARQASLVWIPREAARQASLVWIPRCPSNIRHEVHKERDRWLCTVVKAYTALHAEVRRVAGEVRSSAAPRRPVSVAGEVRSSAAVRRPVRPLLKRRFKEREHTVAQPTTGRPKKPRVSSVETCSQIQCPYERLARACKVRSATVTPPSDHPGLDQAIQQAHDDIVHRIKTVAALEPSLQIPRLHSEQALCQRHDGKFWNGRIMQRPLARIEAALITNGHPNGSLSIHHFLRAVLDDPTMLRSAMRYGDSIAFSFGAHFGRNHIYEIFKTTSLTKSEPVSQSDLWRGFAQWGVETNRRTHTNAYVFGDQTRDRVLTFVHSLEETRRRFQELSGEGLTPSTIGPAESKQCPVRAFLDDDCVRVRDAEWGGAREGDVAEYAKTLYGVHAGETEGSGYVHWCDRNEIQPVSQKQFGERMTWIFGKTKSTKLAKGHKKARAYLGVRLKTELQKKPALHAH